MNYHASIFVHAGLRALSALILLTLAIGSPLNALALTPDDTYLEDQWYLEQIAAQQAWDVRTDASDVTVAVIDGGIYLDHPDITDNIWINEGEVIDGIDNDGNGFIDDLAGWDFVDDDNNPSPDPDAEEIDESALHHGTVVAGIIGAVGDNGEGIAGIAWDVNIMPLRALDSVGAGTDYWVSNAIYYAIDNGADIINLSLTGFETTAMLNTAIEYAYANDVVVVAAAGNENVDTDIQAVYPSCLRTEDDDWVIGVTATDFDDQKASFSNYGSECSDISAPGVGVFAAIYEDLEAGYLGDYMGGWAGTSFAAPMVAGAAALLLAEYPSLTPAQIQLSLELGADPLNLAQQYRGQLGTGRLNIFKSFDIGEVYSDQNSESTIGDGEEQDQTTTEDTSEHQYIRGMSFSDVYRVIDGKRYVFYNAQSYFTWEETFDPIEFIPDDQLSQYPFGGVMLPKGETVLVKIQSVPKVYAIWEDLSDPNSPSYLYHIDSEEIAIEMYGEDWADYVIDLPSAMATYFVYGNPVTEPIQIDRSKLIKREELARRAQ